MGSWWRHGIKTLSALLALCAMNPLELWCHHCCKPEQAVYQTGELSLIWNAVTLMWRHSNEVFPLPHGCNVLNFADGFSKHFSWYYVWIFVAGIHCFYYHFLHVLVKDRAHLSTFKFVIFEKFSCFIVLVVFLVVVQSSELISVWFCEKMTFKKKNY